MKTLSLYIADIAPRFFTRKISTSINRYFAYLSSFMPHEKLSNAIATTLKIHIADANEIANKSFLELLNFISDYQYMALKNETAINQATTNVQLKGEQPVVKILAANRPIIAVSIHMSNFFAGNIMLKSIISAPLVINILKYQPYSKKEAAAYTYFENDLIKTKIHRLSENPALKLIKALKNNELVLTYLDVSPELVETMKVTMFNKDVSFPKGPAELAAITGAVIVPFIVSRMGETSTVAFEEPIEVPLVRNKDTLVETVKVITQKLANHYESWIRRTPEQWHMWPLMEE